MCRVGFKANYSLTDALIQGEIINELLVDLISTCESVFRFVSFMGIWRQGQGATCPLEML